MSGYEILLMVIGGFFAAAGLCVAAAFAIYKLLGEDNDERASW